MIRQSRSYLGAAAAVWLALAATHALGEGISDPTDTTWDAKSKKYWEEIIKEADRKEHCDEKTGQSPFNIKEPTDLDAASDSARYTYSSGDNTARVIWNDGDTIKLLVNPDYYKPGGKAELTTEQGGTPPVQRTLAWERSSNYWRGTTELDNIHFHYPSEHTWNGIRHHLEIHLVHVNRRPDGTTKYPNGTSRRSVMAIFAKLGAKNESLDSVFDGMENVKEKGKKFRVRFTSDDMAKLLPAEKTVLLTRGSLTTPSGDTGCDNDLEWTVFKTPIEISEAQLKKFTATINSSKYTVNARPLMGDEGRGKLLLKLP